MLSSDPYAGNRWKLLQAWVVEGVGWMVRHQRCELNKSSKNCYATCIGRAGRFSTIVQVHIVDFKYMLGKDLLCK